MKKKKISIQQETETNDLDEKKPIKKFRETRSDEDILKHFKDRLVKMQSKRKDHERDRDVVDKQVEAKTYYSNWVLQVNVPMEQWLIEMSSGRYAGKTDVTIEPIGTPNVDELIPAKYTLNHFMYIDWFHTQKKQWRLDKATYGTGILYTGISYSAKKKFEAIEDTDDFWNTDYIESKEETYYMTPRNVSLRMFYIDDRAIDQPFFMNARDCIMEEHISKEEYLTRYKDRKWFNIPEDPKEEYPVNKPYGSDSEKKKSQDPNTIILYHYYNKEEQDYQIFQWDKYLIYKGKMQYKHWELPFTVTQHYPRNNCVYGRWIPHKVRYLKAYKSEMLQWILDKVRISSWINIGMWNETSVDWDLYTASWEINIWSFTWSVENVKQFQLDSNINGFADVMNILDDIVIQDTWENVKAPYSSPAKTLWETEIIEENKMIRIKSVDESDDIWLSEALTMSLDNITQYAPYLLKTTKLLSSWGMVEQFPTIIVPGAKIKVTKDNKLVIKEEKDKKPKENMSEAEESMTYWLDKKWIEDISTDDQRFIEVEDYGNYWSFEFKPDMIRWRFRVKVMSASTWSKLNYIEKAKFTQYLNDKSVLYNLNPDLAQKEDRQWMVELMNLTYWYSDKFMANSKKSQITRESQQALDNFISLINWENDQNPNQSPAPTTPGQNQPPEQNNPMNAEWTGWIPPEMW